MGAWDFGPFDNDDASDVWYDMRHAKDPVKKLKQMLSSRGRNENERRAAAAFVEFLDRFDRRTMSALKKEARHSLKDLLESDFHLEWKSPYVIRRRLKKEIESLK